ncbi:MAG TPA: phage portal protein [Candidatus Glassbacteria bacterium]|nr:phage portal protein [Candidatus Glassbacteria bacterium]
MSFISNLSNLFSRNSKDKISVMLAKKSKSGEVIAQSGSEIAPPQQETEIERVAMIDLETAYYVDPIVFNGVNLYTRTFNTAKYKLTPNSIEMEAFNRYKIKPLIPEIVTHMCVYGKSFVEILEEGETITGFAILDPKRVDYAKNGDELIVYNEEGLPVGYSITFSKSQNVPVQTNLDKNIELPENSIFVPRDKLLYFPLFKIGSGLYPVGIVEPIYKTTEIKLNVEEGFGQSTYRLGYPLLKFKLGDDRHEPTPQQIQDYMAEFGNLNEESMIGLPHYAEVEVLESKKTEQLQNNLNYFISEQIAGIGAPASLVTGSGEKTNRSVLIVQSQMFERNLKLIQDRISYVFESQIFPRIVKGGKVPAFDWNDVSIQDINDKAERLSKYVEKGLIIPDEEIETLIRETEDLPKRKRDNKKDTVGDEDIRKQESKPEPEDSNGPSRESDKKLD